MTPKEQQLHEAINRKDYSFIMNQIKEAFHDGAFHQVSAEEYIVNKYYA